MTLTLYGSIGSRASRCIWVAEEIGIPYDWQPISTLDGSSRSPEYLAINPSGKIPALTDDGVIMTESLAINQYLAENYGQGGIWPTARAAQARVLQWTFWSATEVEYYIGALFPHLVMKKDQCDHALVGRLTSELMPKLVEADRALEEQEYLLGDFTLADVNLAVQTFTMVDRFGFDLSAVPNLVAWTERCRERPARRRVQKMVEAAARA